MVEYTSERGLLPRVICASFVFDLLLVPCVATCTLLLRYCLLLSKDQSCQSLVTGGSHLHNRLLLFPEVYHTPFDSRFTLNCCCGIGRIALLSLIPFGQHDG